MKRPFSLWSILSILILFEVAAMTPGEPRLMTWPEFRSRPAPKPDATIAYGSDDMQKVDVWRPAGTGPFPTVLMVHGGCWKSNIADRSLMNQIAGNLRHAGYAVWNIDYRGVDRPGGGYPGTFSDTAAAADALIDNAERFHLDTRKIVVVGHSAGGHLALWLAARSKLTPQSPLWSAHPLKIASVISLGGLPDLEAAAASPDNGCGTEVVSHLTGPSTPQHPDVFADTSVPRLLPLGVPQHLVNGEQDETIPMRLGTGYVAKAIKAGDKATLDRLDNTGHVELILPESRAWAHTRELIRAALK
jgi:acetyl esterase/lipase